MDLTWQSTLFSILYSHLKAPQCPSVCCNLQPSENGKTAFFLNARGLSVGQEVCAGDKIKSAVIKEIAYHLTYSLRH